MIDEITRIVICEQIERHNNDKADIWCPNSNLIRFYGTGHGQYWMLSEGVSEEWISDYFQIERHMIVVTVFLLIMSYMEFHWVHN